MKKPLGRHHSLLIALAISLHALLQAPLLFAGDEDMSPNAYHVFDPETGYMMTVDPMSEEELAKARADGTLDRIADLTADPPPQSSGAATPRFWLIVLGVFSAAIAYLAWRRFLRDRAPRI
ncbi:MAG: hypothetical protein HKN77_08990 [Woeseiaceae bacterium]|nr:hypothetical protein [Woeseiaceae bacterium]